MSLGVLLGLLYGWVAWKPASALPALRAYPRTVWPGRVLTAICVVWFAWNLWQVDLGGFNELKKLLVVLVPVGIFLITVFIPDLLSVRGLCVLVLLAGQPLLTATRWSGTPASPAVALFVYVLLIKAMVLVVYPHLWIRGLDWWQNHSELRRSGIVSGAVVAAALLISGLVSL